MTQSTTKRLATEAVVATTPTTTATNAAADATTKVANAITAHLAATDPHGDRAYTNAQITAALNNLINSAPGTLDTLGEIATQLATDESAVGALTAAVNARLVAASNLSDLPDKVAARGNLGLGTAAEQGVGAFEVAGAAATAQAFARQRANHTGTQPSSTISDFPFVNAADYGWATGATAATNNTAIASATTAALAAKKPLYLPPGTFNISTPIDWRASELTVFGAGTQTTIIQQQTTNTQIALLGHFRQNISEIGFQYATAQAAASTNSVGLLFHKASWGIYRHLTVLNASRGVGMFQGSYTLGGDTGGNWVFSNTFSDINVSQFSITAYDFRSTTQSTGNVFTNVYANNRVLDASVFPFTRGTCTGAVFDFANHDEFVVNQINIEHCTSSGDHLIKCVTCFAPSLSSIHIENSQTTLFNGSLIHAYDRTRLNVRGLTVKFCTFPNAGEKSWFYPVQNSSLDASSVFADDSNTVAASVYVMVKVDSTTGAVFIRNADTTALTANFSGDATKIKSINGSAAADTTQAEATAGNPTAGGTTVQTIAAGAFTRIILNNEVTDLGNNFTPAANATDTTAGTSIYTVPTTGLYLVVAKVRVTDSGAANVNFGIGAHTSLADNGAFQWQVLTSGNRKVLNYQRMSRFNTGDPIQMIAYADTTPVPISVVNFAIVRIA